MVESERLRDPLDHRLHGVAVYNPDLLSEVELKQLFIARHDLLDRFVEDLRIDRPSHKLLLGSRGMGKSTFLRRLRFAIQDDPELSKKWLPLVFPEEQYNVTRLSDFYLNCLDAITDALEYTARTQLTDELDRLTEELAFQEDNVIATSAKDVFQEMSQRIGQGFVLLVDNAERILDELSEAEEWDLRNLLSEEDWLVLVGASAQGLESSYEYGKPFYDFFDIKELKGLSADDTEKVLRSLAATTGHSQVVEWIERDRGRLKTLNVLSGGNPRTVVLLFQLLVQGIDGDVRSDLERLLDMCTPLYKSRFEELPQQAQQVMDAVALLWEPSTAADVATQARMEVTKVSSQLNRLVRQGTIEKVDLPTTKKTGYQIAERFFNIWYLMRSSRRVRRKLLWLVQFLKVFYSQNEAETLARTTIEVQENVSTDHTLACILVAGKKWFEAVSPARRFLMDSDEDWTAAHWNDIVTFFRESLTQGFGENALHLLIDCGREQQWRPLAEALRAAVGGSKDLLRRQPPEIRVPAQEIYDQLVVLDENQ